MITLSRTDAALDPDEAASPASRPTDGRVP